jgi:phosphoglycerate dehydrogenase-like enzyme
MGCQVLYTARNPVPDAPARYVPLEALLSESEVVSLHVPLTPETKHMIDAAALRSMRQGAILINTARGGLVDSVALAESLRAGHLATAGLDVFETEPVAREEPLLALPTVVATPHVAWITTGTFERSFHLAAENCRRLETGEPLLFRVV